MFGDVRENFILFWLEEQTRAFTFVTSLYVNEKMIDSFLY